MPMLTTLLQQLSFRSSPAGFSSIMREAGRSLGSRFPAKGEVRERMESVNALLQRPLSAATATLPEACGIIGNLIAEVTGRPVRTGCEEYGRKRCCFEVTKDAAGLLTNQNYLI
jgi:hypothetical protein